MKPRYTKRVREEAALICAIAASTPGLSQDYAGVCSDAGFTIDGPSYDLAVAAWELCEFVWPSNVDAEAESLLRDGWSP